MRIGPVILLVVYRAQVQVGLQLPVGAFYLTNQIIIVPCRLLVQLVSVGTQEVDSAQTIHVLRHGDAPLDVAHVFRVLLVTYVVYDVVFGY